jgi:hypothetical protein
VTLYLLDIASYQGSLKLIDVKAAGFTLVNFKISHGTGLKSVHPDLDALVAEARELELGISTFHWLNGTASGRDQAQHAIERMRRLGLDETGHAHVVDIEEDKNEPDADERIWRDYTTELQAHFGRYIITYSADWWWGPHGWPDAAGLTPYLHAAPNASEDVDDYPGDDSEHWYAGYGGWTDLSLMQYAVKPLPGGSIDVSMSAIRDPMVWHRLCGNPDEC